MSTSTVAFAQSAACPDADASAAERSTTHLGSWRALHASFQRFRSCDEGAIGEGYSEAVSLLFVNQWRALDELAALMGEDPGFGPFVMRHLDLTVPSDRLDAIRANARQRCPITLRGTCSQVLEALDRVDAEAAEVRAQPGADGGTTGMRAVPARRP